MARIQPTAGASAADARPRRGSTSAHRAKASRISWRLPGPPWPLNTSASTAQRSQSSGARSIRTARMAGPPARLGKINAHRPSRVVERLDGDAEAVLPLAVAVSGVPGFERAQGRHGDRLTSESRDAEPAAPRPGRSARGRAASGRPARWSCSSARGPRHQTASPSASGTGRAGWFEQRRPHRI